MHHQSKTKASRKVADHGSYCIIHDQFIDHYSAGGLRPLESLAWAWAPVLRAALPGSMHHQSKTKASRKVAIASYMIYLSIYKLRSNASLPASTHQHSKAMASKVCIMHDQCVNHSAGGLRPLERLAWAWARAQVLWPVALPADITIAKASTACIYQTYSCRQVCYINESTHIFFLQWASGAQLYSYAEQPEL